jgi:hypothetical protein
MLLAAAGDHCVTVIGSGSIKMQLSNSQEIETRKIAFCLREEIDKTALHTKPRKKFAEDGRLKAYGAGGRNTPNPCRSSMAVIVQLATFAGPCPRPPTPWGSEKTLWNGYKFRRPPNGVDSKGWRLLTLIPLRFWSKQPPKKGIRPTGRSI